MDGEDEWSDIDLAFGVRTGTDRPSVLADWSTYMYDKHLALHHLDLTAGVWIYRVFLLPGTLQVDLAFVEAGEFGPIASTFRLVSGNAKERADFRHHRERGCSALAGFMRSMHALASQDSDLGKRNTW